ncbi:MAG: hypothetical protein AAGB46_02540 [Verrucomicrobiota bacterium]
MLPISLDMRLEIRLIQFSLAAVCCLALAASSKAELTLNFTSGTSGSIFSSSVSGAGDPITISDTTVDAWRGQTFVARVPNDEVEAGWYLSMISLYFDAFADGDRVFGPDDVWTVKIVAWDPQFASDDTSAWESGSAGDPFSAFAEETVVFEDSGKFASDTTLDRTRWLRFELEDTGAYFLEGGKAYVILFKFESSDGATFLARTTAEPGDQTGVSVFQTTGQAPSVFNDRDIKMWIHGSAGTPDDGRDLAPRFDLGDDIELPMNWEAYQGTQASGFEAFGDGESLAGYTVTTDNDALFSELPAIDESGVLRFKAATDASGSAVVSVYVSDTGATNNRSGEQSFTITIRDREAVALHVNADSEADFGAQDGLSWATAYSDLQDALADAFEYDEIWVAAGRYYPDQARAGVAIVSDDDEEASFSLVDGVNVYGGFSGVELSRNERDYVSNVCILSGDIDHETNPDDSEGGIVRENPGQRIKGTNAICVVTGTETGNTLLDGFTITAGYSTSYSLAGGFSEAGRLRNCLIQGNWGRSYGGIRSYGPVLSLVNCRVYSNFGNNVGGLNVYGAELDIISCRIQGNEGVVGDFYSSIGGLSVAGCNGRIAGTLISGNQGLWVGGIMISDGQIPGEQVRVDNCTIVGNRAWDFEDRRDDEVGGLHVAWYNKWEMRNSVVWGNEPLVDAVAAGIDSSNTFHSLVEGATLGGDNLNGATTDGDSLFALPKSAVDAPHLGGVYALKDGSALEDAGSAVLLLSDNRDLDGDGDLEESLPWDLAGNERVQNVLDVGAFEWMAPGEPSDSVEDFRSNFGLSTDGSNDGEDWSGHGVENALYFAFGIPEKFGEFPEVSDEDSGTLGLPRFGPSESDGKMKLTYSVSEDESLEVTSQRMDESGRWIDVGDEGIERTTVPVEGGDLVIEEISALTSGFGLFRVKVVFDRD